MNISGMDDQLGLGCLGHWIQRRLGAGRTDACKLTGLRLAYQWNVTLLK